MGEPLMVFNDSLGGGKQPNHEPICSDTSDYAVRCIVAIAKQGCERCWRDRFLLAG